MEQIRTVDSISQKPNIARLIRRWTVPPGLTFSLVEDQNRQIWVVESCPVGSHYWTIDQVAELPLGIRTRRVQREILREARKLEQKATAPSPSRPIRRTTANRETRERSLVETKATGISHSPRHRSEKKVPSVMAMNLLIA